MAHHRERVAEIRLQDANRGHRLVVIEALVVQAQEADQARRQGDPGNRPQLSAAHGSAITPFDSNPPGALILNIS